MTRAQLRSMLLLLLGTSALCYRAFDEAVLQEMCILKCPDDGECRENCPETRQDIVVLQDEEALANVTLVCRDFTYVVLGRNPGLFVIDRRLVGDIKWSSPNGVNVEHRNDTMVYQSKLSPGKRYEFRFHRVLANGISKPYVTEPIQTLPLSPHGLMEVGSISMSKFEEDATALDRLKLEISFSPSEERNCRYEAILWDTMNYNTAFEFDYASNLRVTCGGLEYGKNYTFEAWAKTSRGIQSKKKELVFTTPTQTLRSEKIGATDPKAHRISKSSDETIRSKLTGGGPTSSKPFTMVFIFILVGLSQLDYLE